MPKNGPGDTLWMTDLRLSGLQSDVTPTFPSLLITLSAPAAYPAPMSTFCYKNNKKSCKSKTE